ncbi:3-oxoacyl-ACP reductase [Vibrio nigripulchritudo]|uniref:SDR family NAD(P)-dependent oxidoreductase n=1 Tax=Vibrio nigripulchritudo TaxID=28173 RepID=UPI00190B30C9|nr:SDR family oxidoreductase [Vibrio nigripulchritudo]BCL68885.1 3-oxoacyl-ACP reductase [Vibrio nigripulchritudo]BDU30216.1 3-oxoacyl-ACP reductase [Vibrio nigripulchritudo]
MDYQRAFDFSGKVVAIIGAGSGIGLEAAKAFASCSADLALLDLNAEALKRARSALTSMGYISSERSVFIQALDVTDEQAVVSAAEAVADEFGQVDVLVNSAGIAELHEADEIAGRNWKRVMDVNMNGTFWACRAFATHMLKRQSGAIVNMGSMSGNIINTPQFASSYMASKGGVHQLTKALAVEWAQKGIRVNALAPGYIATEMTLEMRSRPELFNKWIEMTPMGRCGTPSEVAALILFLASDVSSYMTGAIVAIDGGYTCL